MKKFRLILSSLLIFALSSALVYSQNGNSVLSNKIRNHTFQQDITSEIQILKHDKVTHDYKPVTSGLKSLVAYAYVGIDPTGGLPPGPCTFNLDDPGSITSLAPTTSENFIAAATWANGIWYGLEWGNGTLYEIDPINGSMTNIVTTGFNIGGMAWDDKDMYVCSGVHFGSMDLENGYVTVIGQMGNAEFMVGMACDSSGNIYGVDDGDDNLYSINKTTGAATIIGHLGIDISNAQDLEFDKDNDVLYLAGYVSGEGGALYTINTSTGAATLVGEFMNDAHLDGFAIPYYGSTTSISSLKKQQEIFLYPNPVKDIATFSSEEITSFELYDMMGVLIIRGNNNKVGMSNLNQGIYFVVGFDKNEQVLYKGKIIKK